MKRPIRARPAQPATRGDLEEWISKRLSLSETLRAELLEALDAVFARHQQLGRRSKEDAIEALRVEFGAKVDRLQVELLERETTAANIAKHFEQIVAELTERTHRDPKTALMNFGRFIERLHSFLMTEQRGRWCALGLADLHQFKVYNDTLGHLVGDRIIERVAMLLRDHVRSDDLVARELEVSPGAPDMHARFGGDEFCFLLPALTEAAQASMIVSRFLTGIAGYDWTREDSRLREHPVRADVGVVCLWLGPLSERREYGSELAADLVRFADKMMYRMKQAGDGRVVAAHMRIDDRRLVPMEVGAVAPSPGNS